MTGIRDDQPYSMDQAIGRLWRAIDSETGEAWYFSPLDVRIATNSTLNSATIYTRETTAQGLNLWRPVIETTGPEALQVIQYAEKATIFRLAAQASNNVNHLADNVVHGADNVVAYF